MQASKPLVFAVGDVVKLPSCAQMMTVTAMRKSENEVHVAWISADGVLEGGYFPPEALRLVPAYQPPAGLPGVLSGTPIRTEVKGTLPPASDCDDDRPPV